MESVVNSKSSQAVSVFTPQTSSSAALSLATLAVGTHSITAKYSGDANYSTDTSAAVAVTVNPAASATAVTSSANPSYAGHSVTFTTNVTSTGQAPTGNVTFSAGSTMLGSAALSGGVAAYTTTSLTTVGTQTVTASYSGDTNTQASSATVSQVIDAAFALSPGSDGSTTLTVQSGKSVSAPINVTGATGFSAQITFACTGLPANAGCTFSPAMITGSGTSIVPTLLTVSTSASVTTSQLRRDGGPGLTTFAYGAVFASLALCWPLRRRGARPFAILACVLALAAMGLAGCSGGSGAGGPKTAPGTYNFTVTATSGSVQAQSSYVLTVQ